MSDTAATVIELIQTRGDYYSDEQMVREIRNAYPLVSSSEWTRIVATLRNRLGAERANTIFSLL